MKLAALRASAEPAATEGSGPCQAAPTAGPGDSDSEAPAARAQVPATVTEPLLRRPGCGSVSVTPWRRLTTAARRPQARPAGPGSGWSAADAGFGLPPPGAGRPSLYNHGAGGPTASVSHWHGHSGRGRRPRPGGSEPYRPGPSP